MYIYANLLGKWTIINPNDRIDGLMPVEFYDKLMAGKINKDFYLIELSNAAKNTPQQYLIHKSCIQLI